jgi:hypothetical protein
VGGKVESQERDSRSLTIAIAVAIPFLADTTLDQLPVHPVHKTRKLVLLGRQGGNSGKGGKQRKAHIHAYLSLCYLRIMDLQKSG